MDVRPARNINRMFILRARLVAGRRNIAAIGTDAPARGLFFLLLFLWTSKEKVDSKRQIQLNAWNGTRPPIDAPTAATATAVIDKFTPRPIVPKRSPYYYCPRQRQAFGGRKLSGVTRRVSRSCKRCTSIGSFGGLAPVAEVCRPRQVSANGSSYCFV